MRAFVVAFLIVFFAGEALALSCIRPSLERAFVQARDAEELYVPVLGRFIELDVDQGGEKDRTREDSFGAARFVGRPVARYGFGDAMDVRVSVTLRCLAHWCGGIAEDEEVLTFLRIDGSDYHFETGPCVSSVFYSPGSSELSAMRRCLRRDRCEPDQ